MAYTQRLIAV